MISNKRNQAHLNLLKLNSANSQNSFKSDVEHKNLWHPLRDHILSESCWSWTFFLCWYLQTVVPAAWRSSTAAPSVGRATRGRPDSKNTSRSTRRRSCTAARCARRLSPPRPTWELTRRSTWPTNRTPAASAPRASWGPACSANTWGSTSGTDSSQTPLTRWEQRSLDTWRRIQGWDFSSLRTAFSVKVTLVKTWITR